MQGHFWQRHSFLPSFLLGHVAHPSHLGYFGIIEHLGHWGFLGQIFEIELVHFSAKSFSCNEVVVVLEKESLKVNSRVNSALSVFASNEMIIHD